MKLDEILAKLSQIAEDENTDIELSQEELEVLHENFEQLDELSKKTLGSYIKKALKEGEELKFKESEELQELSRKTLKSFSDKTSENLRKAKDTSPDAEVEKKTHWNAAYGDGDFKKAFKRITGIKQAVKKLTKEDTE